MQKSGSIVGNQVLLIFLVQTNDEFLKKVEITTIKMDCYMGSGMTHFYENWSTLLSRNKIKFQTFWHILLIVI